MKKIIYLSFRIRKHNYKGVANILKPNEKRISNKALKKRLFNI